jgi:hypothetical protein
MVYTNLVMARGLERFADDLAAHGMAGLIVPDLPSEESDAGPRRLRRLRPGARAAGGADHARRAHGAHRRRARGFLYAVSVAGTTGERAALADAFAAIVARAKAPPRSRSRSASASARPSRRARRPTPGADGVIVGSRWCAPWPRPGRAGAVHELVARFAQALSRMSRAHGTRRRHHRRPRDLDRHVGAGRQGARSFMITVVLVLWAPRRIIAPTCRAIATLTRRLRRLSIARHLRASIDSRANRYRIP